MQRLLSLATLVLVLGGGWVFLTNPNQSQSPASAGAQGPGAAQPVPPPFGTTPAPIPYGQQTGVPPQGLGQPGPTNPTFSQIPGSRGPSGQLASAPAVVPPSQPSWPDFSRPGVVVPTIRAERPVVPPPTSVGAPPPVPQGPTIRIASFNIQVFGETKASKNYVMQTLAEIIWRFDVVAIQEIRTQDDYLLNRFLEFVNYGGHRKYDFVIGPRLGNTTSTEQYAFLFNTERIEFARHHVYTVSDPDNLLHREPLVAMFRTRIPNLEQAFTFVLVNIHTDPDLTDVELDAMAQVYRAVRVAARGEDDIILLGDFNVDDKHLGQLGQVPGVRAIVSGVPTNTRRTKQYDNLIIHAPSTTEFSGRWGVYDIERLHNLTPAQALMVSDHLPVWAEFSAFESDRQGYRVSSYGPPGPSPR